MDTLPLVRATNLSPQFLVENCEELRDILVPYFTADDLCRLSSVSKMFSSWASGSRRPKLGIVREVEETGDIALSEDAWQPYGYLGKEAAMAKRRLVRLRLRMHTVHTNSDGLLVEHEVPPGSAVDPTETTLKVDLVRYDTGVVEEPLYQKSWWADTQLGGAKDHAQMDKLKAKDPAPIKFMIKHTLSSKRRPPTKFRLRFTLKVRRTTRVACTDYVYETPEFWVLDPDVIPKPGTARDKARKERPSTRTLYA